MTRISVVGTSGTGKTTMARTISQRLAIPHVELDALFHQPGWVALADDEFRSAVDDATRGDEWVVDGNYSKVLDIVWSRATTVVWLDYSLPRVMWRLVGRTLRRVATRAELWNGNRESLKNLVSRHREQNIILWGWTTHATRREHYTAAMADSHHTFVRLRSPSEADTWLSDLTGC